MKNKLMLFLLTLILFSCSDDPSAPGDNNDPKTNIRNSNIELGITADEYLSDELVISPFLASI